MTGPRKPRPSVRKLRMPIADSAIASWYGRADFLDSYAITLDRPLSASMHELVVRMLASPPLWLKALLKLRDALVRPFGVKTTGEMMDAEPEYAHVDFFRIQNETRDEIVLGEDDRHLNFRVSLLKRAHRDGTEVIATTAVRINNRFGRFYIVLIAPFHRLIVRTSLKRLAVTLASNHTGSAKRSSSALGQPLRESSLP